MLNIPTIRALTVLALSILLVDCRTIDVDGIKNETDRAFADTSVRTGLVYTLRTSELSEIKEYDALLVRISTDSAPPFYHRGLFKRIQQLQDSSSDRNRRVSTIIRKSATTSVLGFYRGLDSAGIETSQYPDQELLFTHSSGTVRSIPLHQIDAVMPIKEQYAYVEHNEFGTAAIVTICLVQVVAIVVWALSGPHSFDIGWRGYPY